MMRLTAEPMKKNTGSYEAVNKEKEGKKRKRKLLIKKKLIKRGGKLPRVKANEKEGFFLKKNSLQRS